MERVTHSGHKQKAYTDGLKTCRTWLVSFHFRLTTSCVISATSAPQWTSTWFRFVLFCFSGSWHCPACFCSCQCFCHCFCFYCESNIRFGQKTGVGLQPGCCHFRSTHKKSWKEVQALRKTTSKGDFKTAEGLRLFPTVFSLQVNGSLVDTSCLSLPESQPKWRNHKLKLHFYLHPSRCLAAIVAVIASVGHATWPTPPPPATPHIGWWFPFTFNEFNSICRLPFSIWQCQPVQSLQCITV